jgi:hypothetical protein
LETDEANLQALKTDTVTNCIDALPGAHIEKLEQAIRNRFIREAEAASIVSAATNPTDV